VAVGSKTEMLESFSGVLWSSEEESVASGWCSESQLIQCQYFSTSGKDAGTSGCSESESSDAELGYRKKTVVIGNCTNNHDGSLLFLLSLGNNAGD